MKTIELTVNAQEAARRVGDFTDWLPAGTTAVVLVFDNEGGALCLSRWPFPNAFALVARWVAERIEEAEDCDEPAS